MVRRSRGCIPSPASAAGFPRRSRLTPSARPVVVHERVAQIVECADETRAASAPQSPPAAGPLRRGRPAGAAHAVAPSPRPRGGDSASADAQRTRGKRIAARLDAYERLTRLDKPIGTLLLLWPTLS